MAGKPKTEYVCRECGHSTVSWVGQCAQCKAWSTLEERIIAPQAAPKQAARRTGWAGSASAGTARPIGEIRAGKRVHRRTTHIPEFDRVLGGGVVDGSVVLLGGDPGIGKSTLLLQAAAEMAVAGKVLYVSGEESEEQIADRGVRLGKIADGLRVMAAVEVQEILATLEAERPVLAIIDSIQTVYSEIMQSAPGSVSQIKECAAQLTRYAKTSGCAIFMIGHVTKDGEVAGPRVLEHLVDAVLQFEGDQQSPYRIMRSIKNRFGAAAELGAFEMTGEGLVSVANPGGMFLDEDRKSASGSCIFPLQDGPRTLLIEMQALADGMVGTQPQRRAVGVDPNRMSMLLAVLHKHGGLDAGRLDVFLNAVGGLRVTEPGADVPLLLSMVSSMGDFPLPATLGSFGEIGLNGEIRGVQRGEDRLREMARLGLATAIVPVRNAPRKPVPGLHVIPVRTVAEAIVAADGLRKTARG